MIEVQNDVLHERAGEKSGPTAGEELCQQQATSTKRLDDVDAGVQDNGTTQIRNDVLLVENETKFLTEEAPEESTVSSSFDAHVKRTQRRINTTTGADRPDSAGKPSSCSPSTRSSVHLTELRTVCW